MEQLEKLTTKELEEKKLETTRVSNEINSEINRRKQLDRIKWHREQISDIVNGNALEENICEWCGANKSRGEECDEMTHYTNR